jgi:hypothetical protein
MQKSSIALIICVLLYFAGLIYIAPLVGIAIASIVVGIFVALLFLGYDESNRIQLAIRWNQWRIRVREEDFYFNEETNKGIHDEIDRRQRRISELVNQLMGEKHAEATHQN